MTARQQIDSGQIDKKLKNTGYKDRNGANIRNGDVLTIKGRGGGVIVIDMEHKCMASFLAKYSDCLRENGTVIGNIFEEEI